MYKTTASRQGESSLFRIPYSFAFYLSLPNLKLSTLFKVVRSTTSKATDSDQTPPKPTYHTSGEAVYQHRHAGVAARLAEEKSMLKHVCSCYTELQEEYLALPLHVRRDLFTAANEELIYAAAILEADPKHTHPMPSVHGYDEICPVARDWYTSIGQLMHDFCQRDVDRFSSEYITSLHTRVEAEVARCTKVREMVSLIKRAASPTTSAPIEVILQEWNGAMEEIAADATVFYAVEAAVEASQNPNDEPPPYSNGQGTVSFFDLNITRALWSSANPLELPKGRPAPRWRTPTVDPTTPLPDTSQELIEQIVEMAEDLTPAVPPPPYMYGNLGGDLYPVLRRA